MFFPDGISYIFRALPQPYDNEVFHWLANQSSHREWKGFTMYDLVFPMFIFIVGVAMPFSFSKRMGKKEGNINFINIFLFAQSRWQSWVLSYGDNQAGHIRNGDITAYFTELVLVISLPPLL